MATATHSITAAFLAELDARTRSEILGAIANHYGITEAEAFAEVTDPEAESLLDYLVGAVRGATSVLMQRHGYR